MWFFCFVSLLKKTKQGGEGGEGGGGGDENTNTMRNETEHLKMVTIKTQCTTIPDQG